jgi:serine/threonine protein kinase
MPCEWARASRTCDDVRLTPPAVSVPRTGVSLASMICSKDTSSTSAQGFPCFSDECTTERRTSTTAISHGECANALPALDGFCDIRGMSLAIVVDQHRSTDGHNPQDVSPKSCLETSPTTFGVEDPPKGHASSMWFVHSTGATDSMFSNTNKTGRAVSAPTSSAVSPDTSPALAGGSYHHSKTVPPLQLGRQHKGFFDAVSMPLVGVGAPNTTPVPRFDSELTPSSRYPLANKIFSLSANADGLYTKEGDRQLDFERHAKFSTQSTLLSSTLSCMESRRLFRKTRRCFFDATQNERVPAFVVERRKGPPDNVYPVLVSRAQPPNALHPLMTLSSTSTTDPLMTLSSTSTTDPLSRLSTAACSPGHDAGAAAARAWLRTCMGPLLRHEQQIKGSPEHHSILANKIDGAALVGALDTLSLQHGGNSACFSDDWIDPEDWTMAETRLLGVGGNGIVTRERIGTCCQRHGYNWVSDTWLGVPDVKATCYQQRASLGNLALKMVAIKTVMPQTLHRRSISNGSLDTVSMARELSIGCHLAGGPNILNLLAVGRPSSKRCVALVRSIDTSRRYATKEFEGVVETARRAILPQNQNQNQNQNQHQDITYDTSFGQPGHMYWRSTTLGLPHNEGGVDLIFELAARSVLCFITLRDRLRPLPFGTFLNISWGLVRSVANVHYHGFVHRDIKPDNIMLSEVTGDGGGGHVRLADFGASIPVSEDPSGSDGSQRSANTTTYFYRAPEQTADVYYREERVLHEELVKEGHSLTAWRRKNRREKRLHTKIKTTPVLSAGAYGAVETCGPPQKRSLRHNQDVIDAAMGRVVGKNGYLCYAQDYALGYGQPVDAWAVGVVLIELMIGEMLFGPPSTEVTDREILVRVMCFFTVFIPKYVHVFQHMMAGVNESFSGPDLHSTMSTMKRKFKQFTLTLAEWATLRGEISLCPEQLQLVLEGLMHPNPAERSTLAQVMASRWFKETDGYLRSSPLNNTSALYQPR